MDQITIARISVIFTLFIMIVITGIVISIIQRTPSVAKRKATHLNVLFVVSQRRWQSVMIRSLGILFIIIGGLLLLIAITSNTPASTQGMGIGGGVIALGGILFIWLAHGVARMSFEVTNDTIWVFPMAGSPWKVMLSEVTKLEPLTSNNYGGIVARSDKRVLFRATRIMLGYPQLIEYFQSHRSDLEVPVASLPLQ